MHVASESKHVEVLVGGVCPVRWLGSGHTHGSVVLDSFAFPDVRETLCGEAVPRRDLHPLDVQAVIAGDVDCPVCLEWIDDA